MIGAVALLQWPGAMVQQLALMLVLPFAVLSFATRATPAACRAGRFGDPSYGIYLYAFPVQQLLFHAFPGMGPMSNTVVAIPIVLLFAYASWHLVEKRILKRKPRAPARAAACTEAQPA
jgi:peptidoglycan/LPS O-acetylase OafA/YrhL